MTTRFAEYSKIDKTGNCDLKSKFNWGSARQATKAVVDTSLYIHCNRSDLKCLDFEGSVILESSNNDMKLKNAVMESVSASNKACPNKYKVSKIIHRAHASTSRVGVGGSSYKDGSGYVAFLKKIIDFDENCDTKYRIADTVTLTFQSCSCGTTFIDALKTALESDGTTQRITWNLSGPMDYFRNTVDGSIDYCIRVTEPDPALVSLSGKWPTHIVSNNKSDGKDWFNIVSTTPVRNLNINPELEEFRNAWEKFSLFEQHIPIGVRNTVNNYLESRSGIGYNIDSELNQAQASGKSGASAQTNKRWSGAYMNTRGGGGDEHILVLRNDEHHLILASDKQSSDKIVEVSDE